MFNMAYVQLMLLFHKKKKELISIRQGQNLCTVPYVLFLKFSF